MVAGAACAPTATAPTSTTAVELLVVCTSTYIKVVSYESRLSREKSCTNRTWWSRDKRERVAVALIEGCMSGLALCDRAYISTKPILRLFAGKQYALRVPLLVYTLFARIANAWNELSHVTDNKNLPYTSTPNPVCSTILKTRRATRRRRG